MYMPLITATNVLFKLFCSISFVVQLDFDRDNVSSCNDKVELVQLYTNGLLLLILKEI